MRKRKMILAAILCMSMFISSIPFQETAIAQNFVEGYLARIEQSGIWIEKYSGETSFYMLAANASFSIDTVPVTISYFKPGMEVYGLLRGNVIYKLEGYSTEIPGYVSEGSIVRKGTVKSFNFNSITLQLQAGVQETYSISPVAFIIKGGQNIPLSSLYPGDQVKLYFDDIYNPIVVKIEVQNESVMIKDLCRGVISRVDPIRNTIIFDSLETFSNGKWKKINTSTTLAYNNQLPIYMAGEKVSVNHLKYLRGRTAYMAVKDFFGTGQIEKIVIKQSYESSLTNKIKEVNYYNSTFELDNGRILSYNDGTIVIKNGRLLDKEAISEDQDVFIAGDGKNGEFMANIVYVYNEEINHTDMTNYMLYYGNVYALLEESFELRSMYSLPANEWIEPAERRKTFYFDSDVSVFDMDNQTISSVMDELDSYYKDDLFEYFYDSEYGYRYAYVYAEGDRVSTIAFTSKKQNVEYLRTTIGTVVKVEDHPMGGWLVTLKNAADWSAQKNSWMPRSSELTVILEQSAIVKDGKAILPQDIKPGDRLYIVREVDYREQTRGSKATFVIVK